MHLYSYLFIIIYICLYPYIYIYISIYIHIYSSDLEYQQIKLSVKSRLPRENKFIENSYDVYDENISKTRIWKTIGIALYTPTGWTETL